MRVAGEPIRRWLVSPVEVFLVVIVSFFAVLIHMEAFTEISPFDEATHVDYLLSVADFDVPTRGEAYHQEVLREWSCRGSYSTQLTFPSCTSASFDHSTFPGQGVQRNDNPPLYYLIVATLTQPIARNFGVGTVGLARLAGFLFLAVGTLGGLQAARQLGAKKFPSMVIMSSAPLALPTVLHATSTVNSDALVYAVGGISIAVALAIADDQIRSRWMVVVAVMAGLSKETALFPVAVASVVVLRSAFGDEAPLSLGGLRSIDVRRLGIAIVSPILCLMTVQFWNVLAGLWTPDDWTSPIGFGNTRPVAEGDELYVLYRDVLSLMPPTRLTFVPEQIRSRWHAPWAVVIGLLVVMGFGSAVSSSSSRRRAAAWGLLGGTVTTVIVIQGFFLLKGRAFPEVSSRYAVGLVPIALAIAAVWVAERHYNKAGSILIALGSLAVAASSLLW